MLEPKAPPARNGPNTGSLAPGVRKRVNKKKDLDKYHNFLETNSLIVDKTNYIKLLGPFGGLLKLSSGKY